MTLHISRIAEPTFMAIHILSVTQVAPFASGLKRQTTVMR